MPADHFRELADLAAGDLDPGRLGADPQSEGDLAQQLGVGGLDGQVVQEAPAARRRHRSGH